MAKLTTPFDAATIAPHPRPEVSTGGLSAAAERLAETRYQHVPDAMRAGRWWMVARAKAPQRVTRKGPLVDVTGADWTNSANHCAFEDALAAISTDGSLNLMLMLGFGNEFVCVDVDPLEKVSPEYLAEATKYREQLRERLNRTYSEVSLSGAGMHFIGIGQPLASGKNKTQHPEYKIDLLFRYGLVLTGDHREGTTEIADIAAEVRAIQTHMESGDGQPEAAALPSVDTLTPAHCDESRLISILSAERFKHGEAFRTGQNVNDWSGTFAALLNTAAEFCTDEQLVLRVLTRSKFVQMAEDKGGETRLAKVQRLWPSQWPKALERTEPTRRANHTATALTKALTLADLWDQSPFVQYMVQDRATSMIQENLIAGASAEDIAPLFRYLRPDRMNQLQDDLRRVSEEFAKTLTDARILVQNDTEVMELNAFMAKKVRQERVVNPNARYEEYNRKFYIVKNYGGAARVFRNGFHDDSGAQDMWPSLGKFCEAFVNDQVLKWRVGKELIPELVPFASEWVLKTHRRFARQEMRFETTEREITVDTGERVLNLYQGWATTPVAGDWSAIRYLIHDILCSGVAEASEYLLNYLAHMVQKPHQLPGTAIILRSEEQGTGKSTFMALLRQLLGPRYCASTSDADHFVGTHNDRAMNKVLLHFEEAVAPNDRKIESRLKALITNETISYNPKGIAVIEARNFARVFMTSNAQQVAHLARHDRRMFVLDVSPRHANDPAFWGPFNAQYPQEIEAFMHALQTRDISGFRPAVMPHTDAKDAQKVESIVGTDRTLRMILEDGRLPPCSRFDGHSWDVRVSALTDFFIKYRFEVGGKTPQPAKVFKPITLARGFKRLTVGDAAKSYRVLTIPRLQEARRLFLEDQRIIAHDWGDDPDADWALD